MPAWRVYCHHNMQCYLSLTTNQDPPLLVFLKPAHHWPPEIRRVRGMLIAGLTVYGGAHLSGNSAEVGQTMHAWYR